MEEVKFYKAKSQNINIGRDFTVGEDAILVTRNLTGNPVSGEATDLSPFGAIYIGTDMVGSKYLSMLHTDGVRDYMGDTDKPSKGILYSIAGTGRNVRRVSDGLEGQILAIGSTTIQSGDDRTTVTGPVWSSIKTINNESILGTGNISVSGGTADLITNTTWTDLVHKRDVGDLIPGMLYRITDYETIINISLENAKISDIPHRFDVIVLALSESELSEDAWACHHEYTLEEASELKKTYGNEGADNIMNYFSKTDISAWKLKYCLDNDITRFDWAKTHDVDLVVVEEDNFTFLRYNPITCKFEYYIGSSAYSSEEFPEVGVPIFDKNNAELGNITSVEYSKDTYCGKGVIYYMRDEFNNECPYDFKNIMFLRYPILDVSKGAITLPSMTRLLSSDLSGLNFSISTTSTLDSACYPYNFRTQKDVSDAFYYTFCYKNTIGDAEKDDDPVVIEYNDLSVLVPEKPVELSCSDNRIGNCYVYEYYSDKLEHLKTITRRMVLPNNIFLSEDPKYAVSSNTIGENCKDNTFVPYCNIIMEKNVHRCIVAIDETELEGRFGKPDTMHSLFRVFKLHILSDTGYYAADEELDSEIAIIAPRTPKNDMSDSMYFVAKDITDAELTIWNPANVANTVL